jgi:hypothetical protein
MATRILSEPPANSRPGADSETAMDIVVPAFNSVLREILVL